MSVKDKYKNALVNLESSIDYWSEGVVLDFTDELAKVMHENDISRAELARRIKKSSPYITKVFSGEANFTIETMTKLALAVDHIVKIHVAPKGVRTVWRDIYTTETVQVTESIESDVSIGIGALRDQVIDSPYQWETKAVQDG